MLRRAAELGGDGLGRVGAAHRERDLGAGGGEGARRLDADAGGAAGHHRAAAGEIHALEHRRGGGGEAERRGHAVHPAHAARNGSGLPVKTAARRPTAAGSPEVR